MYIYCVFVFIMIIRIIDDGDVIWLVVVINHLRIPYIIYNMHDINFTDI